MAADIHSAQQHSVAELQSCKTDTEMQARDLQQCHGLLGLKELQLNKLGEDMGAVEWKLRAKEQEVEHYYQLISTHYFIKKSPDDLS